MNNLTRQVVHMLFTIMLIAVLLYGLWVIRSIIIYILLSAVLALIGKPMVDRLTGRSYRNMKANRTIAAIITLLLFGGFFLGLLSIFIPSLLEELQVLSKINVNNLFKVLNENIRNFEETFNISPGFSSDSVILEESLAEIFNLNNFASTFGGLISSLGNLLFALFSILFMTFFFLKEEHLFSRFILALVPRNYESNIINVSPRLKNTLSRYFLGLLIQIIIVSALVSFGLYLIGFENYVAIGFFAGLLNIIPYLGPLIGMAFGIILGLSANLAAGMPADPLTLSIFIIVVFGAVQLIDNFFLQPLIFSTSINAHPLEIFLVISIAAVLAGIPGMIVAVPAYSVLRLLAREFFPDIKIIRMLTKNLEHAESKRTHPDNP